MLTCQNGVLAGQRGYSGNFDTEAVAQRASTALNGIQPQVNGTVEGDNLSGMEWVSASQLQNSGPLGMIESCEATASYMTGRIERSTRPLMPRCGDDLRNVERSPPTRCADGCAGSLEQSG
jgi:hypothetical protein